MTFQLITYHTEKIMNSEEKICGLSLSTFANLKLLPNGATTWEVKKARRTQQPLCVHRKQLFLALSQS